MHVHRTRHAGFFTKVPNATARDHALSFMARGLLAYMLSLPDGAREDVKTLANKSVEGRNAISQALHELESRGYLARTKSRDEDGRISTRVDVFADREGASAQVQPATVPPGTGVPGVGKSGTNPEEAGYEDSLPPQKPDAGLGDDEPQGRAGGEPSRATALLTDIGRREPRLHLAQREADRLTPLVDAWLTRGATPGHVTNALTSGLPERVHQAAALIRHRLTAKMPAEPSGRPARPERHECVECRIPVRAAGRCLACVAPLATLEPSSFASIGRSGIELVRSQLRGAAFAV